MPSINNSGRQTPFEFWRQKVNAEKEPSSPELNRPKDPPFISEEIKARQEALFRNNVPVTSAVTLPEIRKAVNAIFASPCPPLQKLDYAITWLTYIRTADFAVEKERRSAVDLIATPALDLIRDIPVGEDLLQRIATLKDILETKEQQSFFHPFYLRLSVIENNIQESMIAENKPENHQPSPAIEAREVLADIPILTPGFQEVRDNYLNALDALFRASSNEQNPDSGHILENNFTEAGEQLVRFLASPAVGDRQHRDMLFGYVRQTCAVILKNNIFLDDILETLEEEYQNRIKAYQPVNDLETQLRLFFEQSDPSAIKDALKNATRLRQVIDRLQSNSSENKEMDTVYLDTVKRNIEAQFQQMIPALIKSIPQFRFDRKVFGLPCTVLKNGNNYYMLPDDQHYYGAEDKGENVLGKGNYGKVVKTKWLQTTDMAAAMEFISGANTSSAVDVAVKKVHSAITANTIQREINGFDAFRNADPFIQAYDIFEEIGARGITKTYFVMELADKSFDQEIKDQAEYLKEENFSNHIMRFKTQIKELLEALVIAQVRGMVLSDLKSENILMAKSKLKLSDFGNACKIGQNAYGGDLACIDPRRRNPVPADHRDDIYSLGLILFQWLSNQNVYQCTTSDELSTAYDRMLFTGNMKEFIEQVAAHYSVENVMWPSHWPNDLIDLVKQMLNENIEARPSAQALLSHPFLVGI